MRFASSIFLSVSLLSGMFFAQTAPMKSAVSHAAQVAVPPRDAFATVLQTYHASLSPAQMRAAEVVKPGAENRAAVRAGSEKNATTQAGTPAQARFYEAKSVNASLVSLKGDILAKVPADDKPLKGYIEARFPHAPSTLTGYISEGQLQSVNEGTEGLVMELRSMDGFTLDLKVKSNPPKARFSYVGEYQQKEDELSIQTDDTIQQLWRGPYVYTVEVEGYRPVTSKFNTVNQKGDTLECTLAKGTLEGGECVLK
jgi:hypothetical protein